MAKFPEADARLFKGKFVCRKCKSVLRSNMMTIIAKKASCRKCGAKVLKPKRKK